MELRFLNSIIKIQKNKRKTSFLALAILTFMVLAVFFETQLVYAAKDKTPPIGSIVINNGDEYTDSTYVTLSLTAYDPESDIKEVRLSNNGVRYQRWEKFSPTKSWTLTAGSGVKTVYYQIKNKDNVISKAYTDTIILIDATPTSTPTPTPTPTTSPTPTASPTPTPKPTASPTPTPTETPTPTTEPIPTPTTTPTPSKTPAPSPSQNPTSSPTVAPKTTPKPRITPATPSPSNSLTPNPSPENSPILFSEQKFLGFLDLNFNQRKTTYYGIAAAVLIIGLILSFYFRSSK